MCRGKTRQGAPDVASHSLRKVEAYLTVREILPETSKGADGMAWREFSGFGRQQVCNVRVNIKNKRMREVCVSFAMNVKIWLFLAFRLSIDRG